MVEANWRSFINDVTRTFGVVGQVSGGVSIKELLLKSVMMDNPFKIRSQLF